ncbi:actin-like ATPase domain-containing protein [Mycena olivaceomarginata]|nr:actin-like ATPase domain-containing protein [Mycena olivaceomarginata]
MPSNIHLTFFVPPRTNGDVDGSFNRRQVIDQQPKPGPHLHHPTIATHLAHHGSVLSWSSADSPPLPSMTPNYPAAHYDDGYSPAVELGSVGSDARQTFDEGKLVIAIDFGTLFSGVAYGSSRIASGKVQQILNWPGSAETFRKIPTCLLYEEEGRVLAWGLEAKNASAMPGTSRYEWFKLFLDPRALRDESALDPRLPALPPGKTPTDLITDFLSCLWEYARDEAAIAAGLVQSAYPGALRGATDSKIITEPEAAAVHCAHLTDLYRLRPSQNFNRLRRRRRTVDLAVYKIIGELAHLEIAEIAARSGASCGSLFLDLRFRALVEALLIDHPAHLDAASLAYFMHSFSEADKLNYAGRSDDGLANGQLGIPGRLLREAVFDPVVNEVLDLISRQLDMSPSIDALLLVGGFSGSAYLKTRVEEQFNSLIHTLARPPDSDTATLREPEDRVRRPAYVHVNDAGVEICENRQRITTRLCKFSRTRDGVFFFPFLFFSLFICSFFRSLSNFCSLGLS